MCRSTVQLSNFLNFTHMDAVDTFGLMTGCQAVSPGRPARSDHPRPLGPDAHPGDSGNLGSSSDFGFAEAFGFFLRADLSTQQRSDAPCQRRYGRTSMRSFRWAACISPLGEGGTKGRVVRVFFLSQVFSIVLFLL